MKLKLWDETKANKTKAEKLGLTLVAEKVIRC